MDCIFCKIVNGTLPKYQVYEDDLFIGFLDIMPMSKGNTLLVPKKHYRWVNDVPEFGRYWEAARTVANRIQQVLGATSISYLTYGEEVPHAHIRIVPRFGETDNYLTLRAPLTLSGEEMETICKQLAISS